MKRLKAALARKIIPMVQSRDPTKMRRRSDALTT
jgi:hypothetical protein